MWSLLHYEERGEKLGLWDGMGEGGGEISGGGVIAELLPQFLNLV